MSKLRKKMILAISICVFFLCCGCGIKTNEQLGEKKNVGTENKEQTVGVDGLVTMSAELTGDEVPAVTGIIYNKTKKKIETGEGYSLQVLKDDSFVDLTPLPGYGFNLVPLPLRSGESCTPSVSTMTAISAPKYFLASSVKSSAQVSGRLRM